MFIPARLLTGSVPAANHLIPQSLRFLKQERVGYKMLSKIFSLRFPYSYGKRARDPGCEKAYVPLFCHLRAAFLGEAQAIWTSMSAV